LNRLRSGKRGRQPPEIVATPSTKVDDAVETMGSSYVRNQSPSPLHSTLTAQGDSVASSPIVRARVVLLFHQLFL